MANPPITKESITKKATMHGMTIDMTGGSTGPAIDAIDAIDNNRKEYVHTKTIQQAYLPDKPSVKK